MRRRVVVLTICFTVIAILALACTASLAQTASVSVSVKVARSIHVSGNEPGRASVKVVQVTTPDLITYVSP